MDRTNEHLWRLSAIPAALLCLALAPAGFAQEGAPASAAGGAPYQSTIPPGSRLVSDVRIDGNKQIPDARILGKLKTHAGREYRPDVVQDDVRRLFGTYWFYDVAATDELTADGQVIITYRVMERPTISEVVFRGNKKFNNERLQEESGLKVGKAMDPGANRLGARRIEDLYHKRGYAFATVELLEGGNRGDTRVVMNITEGPKPKISDVDFTGNEFVGSQRLMTVVKSKQWLLMNKYDDEQIEADVRALAEYYRTHGYLDVRVGREIAWTADYGKCKLTFLIEEGPRYKVRDVRFDGGKPDVQQPVTEEFKLASGKTFGTGELQYDLNKVRDAYGSKGYVNTVVNADVRYLDNPGEVDIVYQVREDVPKQLGRINVQGNTVTKRQTILKILDLEPGTTIDTVELRRAQQRLLASRIFVDNASQGQPPVVTLDPDSSPDAEFQDLSVTVQEAQTGSLLFGVGVNSDSGLGGSLVINERNFDLFGFPGSYDDFRSGRAFRGAGQELRIELVPGTEVHRYSINFREPRLLGSEFSLSTSGYYYRRVFSPYDEERLGGRFTLGRKLTREIGISGALRLEQVGVQDIRTTAQDYLDVAGQHFLSSAVFGIDHDTRDSALAPSEGHLVALSLEQAFGDFNFPKATLEASQFFTLRQRGDGSGKHVLQVRGELGWSGEDTPVFERFFAGGFRSLRGFDFRGVGPVDAGSGTELGGEFLMLASAEYLLPLTADDNLAMVFFLDTGTVEEDFAEITDYRVAAGFGLRVKVPGMGPVPLAFDFGFPIVQGEQDDEQIFSFFLGFFR